MKTPKREYKKYYICPATGEPDEWTLGNIDARWKRKNRAKQLKRTISRLENTIVKLENTIAQLEKEKENAYHKGHAAGYDAGFARAMF